VEQRHDLLRVSFSDGVMYLCQENSDIVLNFLQV
jgi:hypothetical protein